ncbi:hypothetical protein [Rhizobium lusitanum]|uniref:hypothetical protein n=1 Tax=Rhizobium lusitanum TaxID=293958 RepID=UPI00195A8CDE|nr:hypothetical protein [Rhizobium lusitanum]MBM7048975.1 hypothetical protein [Rhizobium lusitanum]
MHPSQLFVAGVVSTLIACAGPLVLVFPVAQGLNPGAAGSAGLDIAIGCGVSGMC